MQNFSCSFFFLLSEIDFPFFLGAYYLSDIVYYSFSSALLSIRKHFYMSLICVIVLVPLICPLKQISILFGFLMMLLIYAYAFLQSYSVIQFHVIWYMPRIAFISPSDTFYSLCCLYLFWVHICEYVLYWMLHSFLCVL